MTYDCCDHCQHPPCARDHINPCWACDVEDEDEEEG
jgi:hypothetical protein